VLIDWFTVIAQAVNFLILVWLLKRFLYRPILKALDAREKRIAAELAAADAKGLEAEKERSTFQQKNDEFDQQRAMLLSRASEEAQAERHRLIAAARKDADDLRAKRREALKQEYESLSEALTRRIGTEGFAIARKALADLADTALEAHMAETFIRRLRALSPDERARLAQWPLAGKPLAASASSERAGIVVRSTFDLPAAQQHAIEAALKENLNIGAPVRFQTRPDMINGIELVMNGHKVAWNIESYLASLEEEIGRLLKSQAGTGPEPGIDAGRKAMKPAHEKVSVLKSRT
jgi:F-type H+-transporting ATPase subunit b